MNNDTKPKLSIVIPCHNEAEGLSELIATYKTECAKNPNVEVIIVNDASSDNSYNILEKLSYQNPFLRVVTNAVSEGYGNAIQSGLKVAEGEWIGWTHGDSQTPPKDVFRVWEMIDQNQNKINRYYKGRRYGRPLLDQFFTIGMSLLETLLLKTPLWDINAQPNIFHRSFFEKWNNPPKDFSFDLYAYYLAKQEQLEIVRFPVFFGPRKYGSSTWNTGTRARIKFIKRTLAFSNELRKKLKQIS